MMKESKSKISRRQAIRRTSALMGGSISSSLALGVLSGCTTEMREDWTPQALTTDQVQLIAAFAEQILPSTSTPGAKEAKIERFIDSMVSEYLTDSDRSIFMAGLTYLDKQKFVTRTPDEQRTIVAKLAKEARNQKKETGPKPFFLLAKEMILLGFFTSKIGATQVLNYDPIPGSYHGCLPLAEVGGKTWVN